MKDSSLPILCGLIPSKERTVGIEGQDQRNTGRANVSFSAAEQRRSRQQPSSQTCGRFSHISRIDAVLIFPTGFKPAHSVTSPLDCSWSIVVALHTRLCS